MAGTTTIRRATSFRFSSSLLDTLKTRAKEDHRSLNSYVEAILADAIEERPNVLTLAAINETRENDNLESLDVDNFEQYVKSL